jgi:hypothetical protein
LHLFVLLEVGRRFIDLVGEWKHHQPVPTHPRKVTALFGLRRRVVILSVPTDPSESTSLFLQNNKSLETY